MRAFRRCSSILITKVSDFLARVRRRADAQTLNVNYVIEQEDGKSLKEPLLVVYKDNTSNSEVSFSSDEDKGSDESRVSTDGAGFSINSVARSDTKESTQKRQQEDLRGTKEGSHVDTVPNNIDASNLPRRTLDEKLKEMKDQVIRAKAYLNFSPANSSSHFVKELKLRIRDVQRAMSQSTKDSRVSRRYTIFCSSSHSIYMKLKLLQNQKSFPQLGEIILICDTDSQHSLKMKAMDSTLLKASRIYPDCSAMVKKLRAMTYNAEEQVRTHQTQESFLKELGGRTIPKGLHCLSMRLTAEYYALEPQEREFPNKYKRRDPDFYHFAVFSDNILACSVVVNSTVSTAREPGRIVFHIVTDPLNFPSISMWFLSNPPGKATVHVESTDSYQWLYTKYNVTTKKEASVDPRYTSELNHLRFYLPDLFPNLNKIILLDHDVVVRKDLTRLWSMKMRGRVNGAVQTCDEGELSFRSMDMFINFTDPVLANKFDSKTCTWAFGMNLFNLQQWRRRCLTQVYHKYLQLGKDRPLWRAGSLPIGWITFYGHTVPLNKKWHLLGLGYDSNVRKEDIEQAAVIHYDGNLKPWLDIGVEKYKFYWQKHVKYEHPFLQSCNIHE
ncbi:putative galacturonosyltransferase 6-like [Dorcoceras hygrometricum]|uniref:Hexosyltransferase n=1 Tax=Dorcoceras hygrometricum TaxID=472368 RepID=A0A2Z7AT29_9LAMI|nr:putative galacturonosyltransferase 6-like [Dorcoceras hygrometricum]